MTSRRRFLAIIAGAVLAGRGAGAAEWQGRAMGADARILIRVGRLSDATLARVLARIRRVEQVFSLHAESELARLNRGETVAVSPELSAALHLAQQVHAATGGAFDPAVQPLWAAEAAGKPKPRLLPMAGITQPGPMLRLPRGQALTMNGLAQGLATDLVAAELAGLGPVLVDIGEQRALEGDFRLELVDPAAGGLGQLTLRAGRAVATSAPGALRFPSGASHIIGPAGQPPLWSSVTVEAGNAALADAASTAFTLMPALAIQRARARLRLGPVRVVDTEGNLSTIPQSG